MEKVTFGEKLDRIFNRGFFFVFLGLFLITFIGGAITVAVFGELGLDYPMPVYRVILRFAALFLSFAALAALFIAASRFLQSDRAKRLDDRAFNTKLLVAGVLLMLAVQLVFAFCLEMNPITDVRRIDIYAAKIVTDNSFDCLDADFNTRYIIRYQNNLTMLFLVTAVYKITYLLTGTVSHAPLIVLNVLSLNAAVWMTVMLSRRLFGGRKAVLTLLLCALFTPYYTYTPYFYTDSFSIPLTVGTVYAFIAAVQSKTRMKKIMLLLLSGALCFIGFKIKGSVIILIPAVILYLLLHFGIRRAVKTASVLLLSFSVLLAASSVALKSAHLISDESSDRYQFPPAHWVMMGLKDFGAYNAEDSDFTESFPTMKERKEANLQKIGERIREKGFIGMVAHIGKKAVWTYMDGTYYIANYLENYQHWTPLHSFILYEGKYRFIFFAYSFGYQLFLLLMIAFSGLHSLRKRQPTVSTLLRLALFGMFLFFLIWETNARYPFNFTPFYILLATESIGPFSARIKVPARLCRKTKKSA